MKRILPFFLFLLTFAYYSSNAQSVPFPTGTRDNNALEPWGYNQVGTNWDTSPYLPFIYHNRWFRLMPPNGVTYNSSSKTWNFSEPEKKYPLIIFFHGLGEAGTDNNNQLKHGGQRHRDAVLSGEFPGFLFYPQSSTIDQARDIVEKLITTLPIDYNRIYVHGLSNGGGDTWKFLLAYPGLVAAAFPMSAASDDAKTPNLLYTPLRQAQGALDTNPTPGWAQTEVDWFNANGGHLEYFLLPGVGHGTWNYMYNRSDFFSWFLEQKKNKIFVRFNRNEICPGDPINVTMGFSPGLEAYEWRKDGVLMSGATQNTITVTQFGTYTGRVRNRGVWTDWAEPIVVKTKDVTQTPPIERSGLHSIVLPAPDGSTTTQLELPEGYETYTWKNAQTNQVVSTDRIYTSATVGTYKAVVKEFNGCSSIESPVYTVIDANGPNKPDAVSGFIGYATSQTEIALTWIDNPSPIHNETGFEIYRGTSESGPFKLIALTESDVVTFSDSDLLPNTEYFYLVRPVNSTSAGPVSETIGVVTKVDATPPTTPVNLQLSSSTRNSATLNWETSTDNVGVYRYDIYKNGVKTLAVSETSATVYNLIPGQVYNFVVKARDFTGNESPESNQVTTVAAQVGLSYKYYEGSWSSLPNFNSLTPVKTGTTANADISPRNSNTNFAFYWEGFINIPVAGNYTFETRSDDGSKLYIGSYNEANLVVNNDGAHGMQYREGTKNFSQPGSYPIVITYYQGGGGYGMEVYWKNTASGIGSRQLIPNASFMEDVSLPGSAPVPPTQLTATAISYNRIDLTWTDNSSNETGFQLYRSINNAGPYAVVATIPSNTTSYSDQAVDPSTKYYYRIQAIGAYGESGFSNEISTGLQYSYYEQSLPNRGLTQIDNYAPNSVGTSTDFDISVRQRDTNIAFKWEGKINIPTTGNYTFYTRSDDGSRLYIDGTQVVDNDYNQGMTERSGNVNNLSAGFHNIKVLFRQATGGLGLEVRYRGPSINKQLIPSSILIGEAINATTLPLPPAPAAPTNLVATSLSPSSIKLTWTDNSSDEVNFEIYRSASNATNFVLYKTLSANTNQFTDEELFANLTYYYKVVAVNVGGSTESNQASAATLNHSPELTAISDITLKYGNTLNLSVMAEDADNESLTLTVQNNPSFVTFVDQGDGSGTLTFSPQIANLGTYNISVIAADTHSGTDTAAFKLVVTDTNPPSILPISDVSVNEGQSGSVVASASSDLGAQNLTWEVTGLPPFAQFSASNGMGTFSLNPDFTQSGVYQVQVRVTDPQDNEASRSFVITVNDVNPNKTVFVNIVNSTNAASPWNNVSGLNTSGLVDGQGQATGIGLNFQTTWWNTWYEGAITGNNSGVYPDNVIKDYYYFGIFGGPNTVDVNVVGLDPSSKYKFSFLGSSQWTGVPDNGSTVYTINGNSVTLNVQNNNQNVATIDNISPNSGGTVTFTMSKAAGTSAGYLNALVIESIYQPGTVPAAPRELAAAIVDSKVNLSWVDAPFNEDGFDIFRSENGGSFTKINGSPVAKNTTSYVDAAIVQGSSYQYQVRAFNSTGNSAFSNTVAVDVPNIAPIIVVTGNLSISVNTQSVISISATDPPTNNVTLSVTGLPSFASYQATNTTSGDVTFNPASTDEGTYVFNITAADGEGNTSQQDVTVTVTESVLYSILVNFSNSTNAPAPWNNTAKAPAVNDTFSNLRDNTNTNRGVTLTLQTAFGGVYNEGAVTGDNSGVVPDAVLTEYYWFGAYGAPTQVTMRVSGLDKTNKYNFKFAASSVFSNNGTISDNGSTVFTIGNKSASVNVQGNTSNLGVIKDVVTNSSGEVFITVTKGLNTAVGYINGMIIEAVPIDPSQFVPTDLSAAGLSKTQIILNWSDNSPTETGFEVYRSSSENGTYTLLATTGADVSTYNDNGVSSGQLYYYKVRALLPGGPSAYTNVASSGVVAFATYVNINGVAAYDAPVPWNNLSRLAVDGDVFYGIRDEAGLETGIRIRFDVAMEGHNDWGVSTGDDSGVYPDAVLKSFYYTNAYMPPAHIVIEGLDQGFNYNFAFMGSIDLDVNVATNFRIGDVQVTNQQNKNSTTPAYIRNVIPDPNSEVLVVVQEAPGSPWSIFNAMVIEAYPTDRKVSHTGSRLAMSGNMKEVRYGLSNPQVRLYPNPAESNLTVRTEDSSVGDVEYVIMDMTGKIVHRGVVNNDEINAQFNLDLTSYSIGSGMYFLKLKYPDGHIAMEKFIKK